MRALLCFVLLFAFTVPVFALQEELEVGESLLGTWEMDGNKTSELWRRVPALADMAGQVGMIPIASPSLIFSEHELAFEVIREKSKYEVQSYDKKTGKLTLSVGTGGRESLIQLSLPNDDTMILDLPMTITGPVQIAYTRKRDQRDAKRKVASPLKAVLGDWVVDQKATEALWAQEVPRELMTSFAVHGKRMLKGAKQIQIKEDEVEYSDRSFVPFRVMESLDDYFLLGASGQPDLEIRVISDQMIQVADRHRFMLAVYVREEGKSEPVDFYPTNRLAQGFMNWFRPIQPRPPLEGYKGVIAKSGNVEIDEIEVVRRRASYSAKRADIVNMDLQLFVGVPNAVKTPSIDRLIKLVRLDDIYDSEGKLLLTKDRRRRIKFLYHPVKSRMSMTRRNGASGPGFSLKLDAPKIGATHLKEVSGEVELRQVTEKLIRFEDVSQMQNVDLTHPVLGDRSIQVRVKKQFGHEFAIGASPETFALIMDWYLVDSFGNRIHSGSSGHSTSEQSHGFSQPIPVDASLVLKVYDVVDTQTFPFTFENVAIE